MYNCRHRHTMKKVLMTLTCGQVCLREAGYTIKEEAE